MSEDRIRVGVIGANAQYGWAKRAHMPALLALPEYEVVAVCTSRRETAEESAGHYGVPLAFHDFREMAAHPDVDLVAVSVRVPWHHPMVMVALEEGKHVFCEWPLGASLGEAEEMDSLAQSRGVANMVGLQARAAPPLLHLRQLLAEGYAGEVLACNMTMFLPGLLEAGKSRAWMADRTKGANTLTIGAGHSMDVLCFCVAEFRCGRLRNRATRSMSPPPTTCLSAAYSPMGPLSRSTWPPSRGTVPAGGWRSMAGRAP